MIGHAGTALHALGILRQGAAVQERKTASLNKKIAGKGYYKRYRKV